ncbi:MAG: hypothetical protein FVQ81_17270 [Candidatus Glassbacteria bacterium]|nr:hypothetical protein [Candidatus Glassbacteria bacterium]
MSEKVIRMLVAFLIPFFVLVIPVSSRALEIPLTATEFDGYTRRDEPVRTGVLLPRGAVNDLSSLALVGVNGQAAPAQFETLTTWPDGSTRWLLVDFLAGCSAGGTAAYRLTDHIAPDHKPSPLKVECSEKVLVVDTGVMRCRMSTEAFDLFESVWLDHNGDSEFSDDERVTWPQSAAGVALTNPDSVKYTSKWGELYSFEIETNGPVRTTVAVKGTLADPDGDALIDYTARLHFYAGTGFVRVFFTLENHNPTETVPGAHWVLGQPGAVLFEGLALETGLTFDGPIQMSVGDGSRDILDRVVLTGPGGIYQESSGGKRWFSSIHMNRNHRIPLTFKGAKAYLDNVQPYQVDRPDAWLHACDRFYGLAVAVRHFWQNFPKGLEASPDGLVSVGLWPEKYGDLHELQGGEIKTHELAFFFHTGSQGSTRNENRVATVMGAFHHPLVFRAPAETYLADGFFDDAALYDPRGLKIYELYQQGTVKAEPVNLKTDIEYIDEYGWRNFGDTWAKNERDKTDGPHDGREVVNHYNLEYDFGYGMLFQSLRTLTEPTLSRDWWNLATAALRHESDIDIYHSTKELGARDVYAGGKFTHTQHGVEAGLATHRGGPRSHWFGSLSWPWGQGGSPESGHFNTRGLIDYYLLTGERKVLESAWELADLVYYKISQDKFPQIDRLSREAGNNLQIMTDAYLLTWDDKYREAAEKIMAATAPQKQWYTSKQGRKENPDETVGGFWTSAIAINAAARWTAVIEEKLGTRYEFGRSYVTAYADFVSRYLAGGPEVGFYSSWNPSKGGRGSHGPWTYRISDVVMFGHKFTDNSELKKRCLKAARDAFEFLRRSMNGNAYQYVNGKSSTMIIGGGHEYASWKQKGAWR